MKLFSNFSFDKLKDGLAKTRSNLFNKIAETISGKAMLDEELLDEIENILIVSDMGAMTSKKIIDQVRKVTLSNKERSIDSIKEVLKEELLRIFLNNSINNVFQLKNYKPLVYLIVGVNGSGKTTSVGKLAYNFRLSGFKVMVVSADTFRAAANDQLEIWARRAEVQVFNTYSKDPSAVVYDALMEAKNNKYDIVLIDTAGRLHTKKDLMDELSKINKVANNVIPHAPHETLLVIDGTSGQNSIIQVEEFNRISKLSGLIITKLDGTAKGGIVFQVLTEKSLPVKFIGVGEGLEDLQVFDPHAYIDAILYSNNSER